MQGHFYIIIIIIIVMQRYQMKMMKMVIIVIIIIIIVIKAVAGEKQLASSDLALCHGKICNPQFESFWVACG